MKFCFAILFVFLSSRTQKLESSFVIVDSKNVCHLTASNEIKLFDKEHNFTKPIHFLQARSFNNGFDVYYGSCSKSVGYYRQEGSNTLFGSLSIINVNIFCGVTPGFIQNTIYATVQTGIIIFFNEVKRMTLINVNETDCRFNILLNAVKKVLYFLEGSCDPYKSNQLGFQDIKQNSTVKLVTISEHVIKVEIDFLTNEIFAITESNDLKKGNIDSDKVTLETVKNAKQNILDITLTPSDIYYIEKDESIIRKMKRSDTEEPVQVFKSVTFDNPQGISYIFREEKDPALEFARDDATELLSTEYSEMNIEMTWGPGTNGKGEGFSASIKLHFVMLLVNMELWSL